MSSRILATASRFRSTYLCRHFQADCSIYQRHASLTALPLAGQRLAQSSVAFAQDPVEDCCLAWSDASVSVDSNCVGLAIKVDSASVQHTIVDDAHREGLLDVAAAEVAAATWALMRAKEFGRSKVTLISDNNGVKRLAAACMAEISRTDMLPRSSIEIAAVVVAKNFRTAPPAVVRRFCNACCELDEVKVVMPTVQHVEQVLDSIGSVSSAEEVVREFKKVDGAANAAMTLACSQSVESSVSWK